MKRYYKTGRIKVTAGIMTFIMLVLVLFSSLFIALHADHDCTGEDCPICACIQQCENNIRGAGSDITAASAVIMYVLAAFSLMSFAVSSFQPDTPVSVKVRLNN
ncbi:MAG: hypothetical protein K5886_04680 [Lachnospiraceae bacterium]|nr:hypothetical protein [Lachnospiraceae bacterium]